MIGWPVKGVVSHYCATKPNCENEDRFQTFLILVSKHAFLSQTYVTEWMRKHTVQCFYISSANPRILGALRRTGGGDVCGWDERMDATHLSVSHSISNRDRGKRSSHLWLRKFLTRFFFSQARDCTTFTLMIWLTYLGECDSAPH